MHFMVKAISFLGRGPEPPAAYPSWRIMSKNDENPGEGSPGFSQLTGAARPGPAGQVVGSSRSARPEV